MKKCKMLVVCIIVVLCIVVGWIGMNNNSIHINELYHSRTEACDISFDMWTAESDGIKYGFEKNGFSQSDVKGYFTEMKDFLHTIDKRLNGAENLSKNKNLEIYVFEDISQVDITKSRNTLILSKSEVENGEYKYPLFQYAYDLNGNSENYGLFEYVNEENYDNDAIAEYLSKQDNQQMLDFFYARISDAFSDQDASDMYKQILASFVTFTIQNNGIDGFIANGFSKDQIVKWGDSIGIALKENDDAENIQEWLFMRDNAHEFHIQYENTTFFIDDCMEFFESATNMRTFLLMEKEKREEIEQYLKKQGVPSPFYDKNQELQFEIKKPQSTDADSVTVCKEDKVFITLSDNCSQETVVHELTHAYEGQEETVSKRWIKEGFSEFVRWIVFSLEERVEAFSQAVRESNPQAEAIWKNYQKKLGVPESESDFDMQMFIDGCLLSYWNGFSGVDDVFWITDPIGIGDAQRGAELSYWEAESFVNYLIDRYSFETCWTCMQDESDYTDVFGKDYQELKADWKQNISDKFD